MSVFGFNKNKGKHEVYTKEETDTLVNNKSDSSHNHDSRYYTQAQVNEKISNLSQTLNLGTISTHNYSRGTAAPSSSSGSDGDIYDQYF